MMAITFDTHHYIKLLCAQGMPEAQAETVVQVIGDAQDNVDLSDLATKADLELMATKADLELMATKADLKSGLRELELKFDTRLKDLQLKLGSMIVGLGGLLVAVKYFG
jgi:hypothetical protein